MNVQSTVTWMCKIDLHFSQRFCVMYGRCFQGELQNRGYICDTETKRNDKDKEKMKTISCAIYIIQEDMTDHRVNRPT